MTRPVLLLFCLFAIGIAGESQAVDPAQRKETDKMLKDLRSALIASRAGNEAAEDLAGLGEALKSADQGSLDDITVQIGRLASEQAWEATGKPKLLAYAGKKAEALNALDKLAKVYASFPSAEPAFAAARREIEEDKPGLLLGDYWSGAALGSVRYVGDGGNTMAWFKTPADRVAKDLGLPSQTFTAADVLGNTDDDNGILLYPDGTTRVRFMVWPGGDPRTCMSALKKSTGMERVKAAFDSGMNYLGVCSGCCLVMNTCFKLWPGKMSREEPKITGPPHDIVMPVWHPLSRMLKSNILPEVVFTGGINVMSMDVAGSEYIGYWRNGGYGGMEGRCALMAYLPTGWRSGRLVTTPAHPEAKRADFLVMMANYAMRRSYALPRNPIEPGKPVSGVVGDRQNLYYEFLVPEGVKRVEAALSNLDGNCELLLRHGEPPRIKPWQAKDLPPPAQRAMRPDRKTALSVKPGRVFILVHGAHDILAGANFTLTVTAGEG